MLHVLCYALWKHASNIYELSVWIHNEYQWYGSLNWRNTRNVRINKHKKMKVYVEGIVCYIANNVAHSEPNHFIVLPVIFWFSSICFRFSFALSLFLFLLLTIYQIAYSAINNILSLNCVLKKNSFCYTNANTRHE